MQKRRRKRLFKKHTIDTKKATTALAVFIIFVPVIFILLIVTILLALHIEPPHPICARFEKTEPTYTWRLPATAYSSTPDQTDSTPFITANGTHVYWGTLAANFLPFKTCVRFPQEFGSQWFVVEDRKHKRFSDSVDIWMPTRENARSFGIKILEADIWLQ